ncbi:MAG: type II secretion system protein GspG [Planctomycetes bacterium]|nr:type II secretion system protein GspG [Planctomycetota bacterium]
MHRAPSKSSPGFTLLELIVVLAILGTLATIVTVKVIPMIGEGYRTKVRADLMAIVTAANTLYALEGRYRESSEELVDPRSSDGRKLPGLDDYPIDPWGGEYAYELTDDGPVVRCLGKDGREGGEGDDADTVWPSNRRRAPGQEG